MLSLYVSYKSEAHENTENFKFETPGNAETQTMSKK